MFEMVVGFLCNSTYDFFKELQSYCRSDVDLLMRGCLAFRQNIIDVTKKEEDQDFVDGIDPFCVAVTVASLCHYIFRNQMLKENQIKVKVYGG